MGLRSCSWGGEQSCCPSTVQSTPASHDLSCPHPTRAAGYAHALLAEGHSLEFFIEGGRSRDGRVISPKLGILSYVVDAVLDGALPQVGTKHRPDRSQGA